MPAGNWTSQIPTLSCPLGGCRAAFVGGSTSTGGNCCPFPTILDEHPDPIYANNMHPACASPFALLVQPPHLKFAERRSIPGLHPHRVSWRVLVARGKPPSYQVVTFRRHKVFGQSFLLARAPGTKALWAGFDPEDWCSSYPQGSVLFG